METTMEMNYCRRCGAPLNNENADVYKCASGHTIFLNAPPATGAVLINDKNEVLMLERAIDPGKGKLDIPGGFCDGAETLEAALTRELEEETGLTRDQYGDIEFVLSAIDPYDFKGEVLPVLASIFKAELYPGASPVAADDAASVRFMPLAEIDISEVYFPAVRAALEKLRGKSVV